MGLFEDVVVNAKSAFNIVSDKAGKLVDVSKLKISETEINNSISKKFEELGQEIYNASKENNEASSETINKAIEEIDNLYLQLDAVKEKISVAKNKVKCRQCGYENSHDVAYCGGCGASLTAQKDDESNL